MSIDIIKEVMDHAPDNLTAAERYALIVLAEDAWLPDREIRHDIDDEFLLKRLRLTAASWSNTRSALQRKKVLEKISGGHNGKRARYRIPFLDEAMLVNRSGEATDGSSSTDPVEQEDELVNRSGESSSTDPVDLTYITPVTPSTTPKAEEGEGGSAGDEQPADWAAQAAALIATLPAANQPGRNDHAPLVAAVAELLGYGWPATNLTDRLTWTVTSDVRSIGKVQLTRLPTPAPYLGRASPAAAAPAERDWCGQCLNTTIRVVEDPETGNEIPCPDCAPTKGRP